MSKKTAIIKPVATVAGMAFVSSMAVSGTVLADAENPFAMTDLDEGYMLAGGHKDEEGKCGEGKCGEEEGEETGEEKGEEGKCGEGTCGDEEKGEEGKCGEGKCGG